MKFSILGRSIRAYFGEAFAFCLVEVRVFAEGNRFSRAQARAICSSEVFYFERLEMSGSSLM